MINNIKKLNPLVLSDPKTLVLRVEEEYHNRIRKIAEIIKNRELKFSNKDDAFFLKKMAGIYSKLGDEATARICFEEANKLI